MKFCTQKSWRISPQDTTGTVDPDFEEIKTFLLSEAQTSQKLTVYDKDRAIRESTDTTTAHSSPVPPSFTPALTSTAPVTDSMAVLTK